MSMPSPTELCTSCVHIRSAANTQIGNLWCAAFPNGIPDELIEGGDVHLELRGDEVTEVVFEKSDDVDQDVIDMKLELFEESLGEDPETLPETESLGGPPNVGVPPAPGGALEPSAAPPGPFS